MTITLGVSKGSAQQPRAPPDFLTGTSKRMCLPSSLQADMTEGKP